ITKDEIAENQNIDNIFNPFNCIQFNKPTVDVSNSNESYIWNNANDEVNLEFISLKATISPGISATSYIEVEKLQNLLISRKDDIDCILKSQPVYIIGIDFQKNSTSPCIACWVAKPLEIPILESLETMFEDKFDIHVESNVNAEVKKPDIIQDFNITASIWAKIAPFEENVRILNYKIDVIGCGIGDMLSDRWTSLKNLGFGYFLYSIEVNISPIPEKKRNFTLKGISQPTQSNRKVEFSTTNDNNVQVGSLNGITGGMRRVYNTKFSSNEWKLSYKGPIAEGERWLYQYVDNNLDKDDRNRGSFAPGAHYGQWIIKKDMQGFCITITQVLRCEVTHGWRRFLPHTKPNLLKLCPVMSHTLKITFNDLNDFNAKFTKLNKRYYTNNDDINLTVGSSKVNNSENQSIEDLNGKIDCHITQKV
ncbi:10877_t:CDS:2, partial [Funneliformis geosporum]